MTDAVSARRFLALWFPFLAFDRWVADRVRPYDASADAPLAFVEKRRGALSLVALSPAARQIGLTTGMALADARAQVPELAVAASNPSADARWLETVADACERYSPLTALDPPDGVVIDVTGCTHLFGSEAALAADLVQRFNRCRVRHAFAATPEAAMGLARCRLPVGADEAEAVRQLPIAALRLDPAIETTLHRSGLVTIGDLATRPSAALAARIGPAAVAMLDRLLGRADSRLTPRRVPPALGVEHRFAEPITRNEDALGVLQVMLIEAADAMAQRGCGGRRFAARFFRSDGAITDLTVETSRPSRAPEAVMRLFRERIDTLADPLDPGFGFDMIRLSVPVLEPLGPAQLAFNGGGGGADALAALIDRLSTRLGRDKVRRLIPCDSHMPERAVSSRPATEPSTHIVWPDTKSGEPPLRPLQLFDPPQPIEVIAEVPDGPPRRFRWRRTTYVVARHEGPERIAPEWWRPPRRPLRSRDYYRIEDEYGRRFWIFRHGIYGREAAHPRWYLHGLFA